MARAPLAPSVLPANGACRQLFRVRVRDRSFCL